MNKGIGRFRGEVGLMYLGPKGGKTRPKAESVGDVLVRGSEPLPHQF